MRGVLLLAAAALLAGAAKRPTSAALRKAFENNRRSVVEVVGPKKTGTGVVVGQGGQVLTSVDFVGLQEAKVRIDGQELLGKVVMASAQLKAAVVVVDLQAAQAAALAVALAAADAGVDAGAALAPRVPPALHAPAVRLDEMFVEGTELVAIERDGKGGLRPHISSVYRGRRVDSPFVEVNVPLQNGTPLFDSQGRLVAICVQRRQGTCRALPIPEVKVQLQQAATP